MQKSREKAFQMAINKPKRFWALLLPKMWEQGCGWRKQPRSRRGGEENISQYITAMMVNTALSQPEVEREKGAQHREG